MCVFWQTMIPSTGDQKKKKKNGGGGGGGAEKTTHILKK